MWYHPKISLRLDTTPDQVRYVLIEVRTLLYAHPKVDPTPARIRFVGFGMYALELEVFAYILTSNFNDYLEIAEDLHLRMMDIIKQAGAALAVPTQTIFMEEGKPPSREAVQMAESKVKAWRDQNELYLPTFPQEKIEELRGTLAYPPEGSAITASD